MDGAHSLVHGSCIAVDGRAALLTGPSGAGKSDLALRCVAQHYHLAGRSLRPVLIADDQVILERRGHLLIARAPPTIAGNLEVRGVGIVDLPGAADARIHLVVELADRHQIPRLPDDDLGSEVLGLRVPVLRVAPFEASAPLKILLRLIAH